MKLLDWIIVATYLAYVIWDGIRLTKHSQTAEGFIQFYYGLPLAMIILCVTVVPFFHRAKVYTAYEYLEKRFDVRVRTLTSFFFLISRGLGVGVIISAPSIVLSIVFGWNLIFTIFAIGMSTTIYTVFGGVQAVTWTDVKQMFVIFFGLAVCLIVILSSFPAGVSLSDGLHLAGSLGKLNTVDTSFNLQEKYTLWSGLIGGLFLMLGYFGCDQSQVQRYLTAKSVDEGRTSLLMSAFLKIPIQFFILLIGVLVFVFYQFTAPPIVFNAYEIAKAETNPQFQQIQQNYAVAHAARRDAAIKFSSESPEFRRNYIEADKRFNDTRKEALKFVRETSDAKFNDVNYVFPTFVLQNMPMGIIGLLIAAIFAAAMSSIAAELNSLATATTLDFYRRLYKPDATDRQTLAVGRISTFIWGIFACVVAVFASNLGSLIEVVNTFGSYFYGSLLGVFVLAFVVKRARARGAFFGLLFGIASIALINNFAWLAAKWVSLTGRSDFTPFVKYFEIEFLWFNVIGCLVTVLFGYLISLTVKDEQQNIA
jgi:Na+/proline symporter